MTTILGPFSFLRAVLVAVLFLGFCIFHLWRSHALAFAPLLSAVVAVHVGVDVCGHGRTGLFVGASRCLSAPGLAPAAPWVGRRVIAGPPL